jgi:hypothetical protein
LCSKTVALTLWDSMVTICPTSFNNQ